jgi:lipopolysaccharide export LptBFGC system permease protein LptF
MVLRTLHSYILRELLRIFLLTASALTTLLAFGGMFRPLTRQGIDVRQLMILMINLMPAMLAYAIPIAALFAAVLVYWRMATDNELTACRAGGVSFIAIVMPAFFLGLVVASIDLGFVNYLVPHFLHTTERAIMRDLGSLLVGQINHSEKFEYNNFGTVYADHAEQVASDDPKTTIVTLHGMAAALYQKDKVAVIVVAREATARITNLPDQDAAQVDISVQDGSAFNPQQAFQRATGSLNDFRPEGRPFIVPSQLRSKPKFLNRDQLIQLKKDPTKFPEVEKVVLEIRDNYRDQQINRHIYELWQAARGTGGKGTAGALKLEQSSVGTTAANELRIYAAVATLDPTAAPEKCLIFTGAREAPLRVEQYGRGKLQSIFQADAAAIQLQVDEFSGTGVGASLMLSGNVRREDPIRDIKSIPVGNTSLSGIMLPESVKKVEDKSSMELLDYAEASRQNDLLVKEARQMNQRIQDLYLTIDSELHSRGSFSLSCLTLVLLGAALGILLQGKNPLAVFVLGFVPAILLVLLITAGRQMAEGSPRTAHAGLVMIWAGNIVILGLVAAVYAKLLRH